MTRRAGLRPVIACGTTFILAASSIAAAGASYTVTDMGSLFQGGSFVWAVNDAGQAVGQSAPMSTPLISQSFLWDGGPMLPLPGFGGAAESLARDINEQGDVCGASATTTFMPPPFQTEPVIRAYIRVSGVTTQLSSLSAGISSALALNESRQVVGWSHTNPSTLAYHACIWQDGVITDLGAFSGSSLAFDINEAGDVVGRSGVTSGIHAVLWSEGGMIDLAPFGAFHSEATALNDKLQIVGNHRTSFTVPFHGFIWEKGRAADLGTLGGTWTEVGGINNAGQVVGASGTPGGFSAFLWENGVMTDLRDLAPDLPPGADASDISDDGHIVAYAFVGGKYHVYMLTPIAVPADLDGDGDVDGVDLATLLAAWGPAAPGLGADLTHDGFVDGLDLAMLLAAWG